MARKLKTYQTSLGFFDQAIAAPSMKAALEAWGTKTNLFHQGVAKEVDDPEIIAATMRKPGVILRRPVGSNGPFKEHAELPKHLSDEVKGRPEKRHSKPTKQPSRIDDKAARKAALAFEREQRQRESERRREEAAQAKERERRQKAVAKAQAAIEQAKRDHDKRASALEERLQAENARWEKQRQKLETALRRARG
jgi:colicin import membrane protein